MLNIVDRFLNTITMYRVVLYGLLLIAGLAIVFGFAGVLPFSGLQLIASVLVLAITAFSSNWLLSRAFGVTTNLESAAITSLIIFLIAQPAASISDALLLALAMVIANASKYLLAINQKHIFNPAAVGAVALSYGFGYLVSWWAGSAVLLPATVIVGVLIVRKIRRLQMFFTFIAAAVVTISAFGWLQGQSLSGLLIEIWTSWPLIFFGTVMFTEPLTTPPHTTLRMQYAVLVGFLFALPFHFGPFFMTPEMALLLGNVFSFLVSPADKLVLTLQEKKQLATEVWEFVFAPSKQLAFFPGQYMEWTLAVPNPDDRGNRRYFTIASSSTEKEIKLGVKIPAAASTYKQQLLQLNKGDKLFAGQLGGEFILPEIAAEKLVFIAGGIGITPFRSMIQYLLDTNQKRDIVLFYVCSDGSEFAYKHIFAEAQKKLGLQVEYVITKADRAPKNWSGQVGYITAEMITKVVPEYANRTYFLSGPHGMVTAYEKVLATVGIPTRHIKTDYFPGF